MKALCIAGTDTGVGKTIVTALLAKYLSKKGQKVITQKWIQTGSNARGYSADMATHLKIMGRRRQDIKEYMPYAVPYIFKAPCSPHLACTLENKTISAGKITRGFKFLSGKFDFVLVEGTGGVLVPFNNKRLVIDIACDLNLAVLLVAENKLGAINHTLLTIEALTARKMRILGVVFNNRKGQEKKIIEDNPRIIKALSGQKILGVLPWIESVEALYEKFIPIGKRITEELRNG
jgi:dethiobiotin synthetase